jgi:DNA-binding NtrC family response regulator
MRVLVVDDTTLVLDVVTEILQRVGAIVTAVGSARAALHALRSEPPDVPVCSPSVSLTLAELERRYIVETLGSMRGNRTWTAKALGISVRGLQYKLRAYTASTPTIRARRRRYDTTNPGRAP